MTKKIKELYKNKIQNRINNNQDINWRETKLIICDTAAEVLDFLRKNYKGQTIENNSIIEQLSIVQKEYRVKIENSINVEEDKTLHNIRNQILKRIKNEIRKNNKKEIEDIAKIIQNNNQSTAMFKAVKQVKNPTVKSKCNSSQ